MDERASWADAGTELKFVELFRNYECLWSDRNKRLDGMSAIASELNIHVVEYDASVDGNLGEVIIIIIIIIIIIYFAQSQQ